MTPSSAVCALVYPLVRPTHWGGVLVGFRGSLRTFGGSPLFQPIETWIDTATIVSVLPRFLYDLHEFSLERYPRRYSSIYYDIPCLAWGEMLISIPCTNGASIILPLLVCVPRRDPTWLGTAFRVGTQFLQRHRIRLTFDVSSAPPIPEFEHPCGELVIP